LHAVSGSSGIYVLSSACRRNDSNSLNGHLGKRICNELASIRLTTHGMGGGPEDRNQENNIFLLEHIVLLRQLVTVVTCTENLKETGYEI